MVYLWGGFHESSVSKESACNAGDPSSIPGSRRSTGKGIGYPLQYSWASLVSQLVKNLPAMWETCVQSLGWEDTLEKGNLPTSVFWPEEFHGLYSPLGRKELDTTEQISLSFFTIRIYHFDYRFICQWIFGGGSTFLTMRNTPAIVSNLLSHARTKQRFSAEIRMNMII